MPNMNLITEAIAEQAGDWPENVFQYKGNVYEVYFYGSPEPKYYVIIL
jgi:hypothetical protein